MPVFELQSPNGETYEVEAPDESSALEALGHTQAAPLETDWSKTLGNIPSSAYNTAAGIYDVVRHPVDFLKTVDDAATGGLRKLQPEWLKSFDSAITPDWMEPAPETLQRQDETANAVGGALKDRYGGWDNIRNTIITDPVGAALDVATIYQGGAGALGKAGIISRGSKVIPGQTKTSQSLLRRAAPKTSQDLAALGPDAMLLDASPSMTGLAQGVATSPTPSRNAIVQALEERQQARVPRLDADRIAALGKAKDPDLLNLKINKEAKRKADPFYTRAKTSAPDLTQEIDATISREVASAEGMSDTSRKVIYGLMDSMDDARNAPSKRLTAERLHSLRQDLDSQIVHDGMAFQALSSSDKASQTALKRIRKSIDDVLKNNLPGFRQGDAIIAKAKKSEEAVDYGIKSLEGGKHAHTPERFNLELKKRDPKMVGEGMKADIRVAVGTQANDLSALRKKVGGENDFNRAKIQRIFGKPAVDRLTKAIDREDLFGRNYADVTRNSQTAQRLESEKFVNKADAPSFGGSETMTGLTLRGTAKLANALIGRAVTRASQPTREALVKALTAKGPDAVKMLDSILAASPKGRAASAIVKALVGGHVADTVNRGAR